MDRQDHGGGDDAAGGAEGGLLDAQDEDVEAVGVQEGVEQAEHRRDEEGHQGVREGRREEHGEDEEEDERERRPGVVADQAREPDPGDHAEDRTEQPPVALDDDLARRGGVEEDDPAGQHGPVPALGGQELAADDGERGPHRDLERGPGGGTLEAPAVVLLGLLRAAGQRDVLGVELLTGAGRGGGVVGFVLGAVQCEPEAQYGACGLTDAAEDVLDGDRGARQVVLVAVAEQPVAYVGDGRARLVGRAPGHQHVQGVQVAAQCDGRGVLGRHLVLRRGGQGGLGQVQGEGVGTLGGARVEQQDAQPFGGDLGVGDAALEQCGGGLVAGAVLQAALDHQGRLVQPGGVPPQVVEDLVQLVGTGVEEFDVGGHQLGDAGPEGAAQPPQDALRCLRYDGEADDGAAREGDDQGQGQVGQGGRADADEQGDEVGLEADQAQGGAAVAEPAAVDGAEDEGHEEGVARDDLAVQQRAEGDRGERRRQAEGEGECLAAYLLLLDGEGGDHRRHGARDQVGDIGAEDGEDDQGERDGRHRPQSRHQSQQSRIGRRESVPHAGQAPSYHCPHAAVLSRLCRELPMLQHPMTGNCPVAVAGGGPVFVAGL